MNLKIYFILRIDYNGIIYIGEYKRKKCINVKLIRFDIWVFIKG